MKMIERDELFTILAAQRQDQVVIHTMSTGSDWPKYSSHELDFFVQGAMGYASSVGLGIASGQPDRRVWVIDGDGSILMNLGTLATIARARPRNLIHIVLDNGQYELTGRIPTPGSGNVDFAALAKAAGVSRAYHFETADEIHEHLRSALADNGPVFVSVRVAPRRPEPMGAAPAIRRAPERAAQIHAYFGGAA
jgi:sulfopyruvate decarboxylase subunit beta